MGSFFTYEATRPYANGSTAQAVVIDNVRDEGYTNAVVEFHTTTGEYRQSQMDTERWLQPGTELTISYREGKPGTVRSADLRSPQALQTTLIFLFTLVAGLACFFNPWTAARKRSQLNGETIREPAVLLDMVKHHAEPQLGETVEAVFPVLEHRPVSGPVVPFGLGLGGFTLGLVIALGGEYGGFIVSVMTAIGLVGVAVMARGRRQGFVAVTRDEFVLLVADGVDVRTTTIESRISRATELPPVREFKGRIQGGPLPFANDGRSNEWHYRGDGLSNGISFMDVITTYIADSQARSAGLAPQDASPGSLDAPKVAEVLPAQSLASLNHYLHAATPHLAELDARMASGLELALPVRPKQHLGPLAEHVWQARRSSVFVGSESYVIVKHRKPRSVLKGPVVVASEHRHATTFDEFIEQSGYRVDESVAWVSHVVSELRQADRVPQDAVYGRTSDSM